MKMEPTNIIGFYVFSSRATAEDTALQPLCDRIPRKAVGPFAGSFFSLLRQPADNRCPEAAGHIRMYLQGQWYDLAKQETNDDPAEALDAVFCKADFSPILGIENPRTDPRMDFIGGIHGVEILKERVDAGRADLAFSLWPVSVEQLMAVSDAGKLMPPKSTWFEPKLRSGLLVHTF